MNDYENEIDDLNNECNRLKSIDNLTIQQLRSLYESIESLRALLKNTQKENEELRQKLIKYSTSTIII